MILLGIALAVIVASVAAQLTVSRMIGRQDVPRAAGLPTGQAVVEAIIDRHDLGVVAIEDGDVDCYLAVRRAIQFGDGRRERASLAAVAIGAHEAGHLLQHAAGYRPWRVWWALALPALLADGAFVLALPWRLVYPDNEVLRWISIALLAVVALAGIVSAVVEVNASRRAMRELRAEGLGGADLAAARRLLVAAGATYVTEAMCDLGYLGRRFRRDADDDEPRTWVDPGKGAERGPEGSSTSAASSDAKSPAASSDRGTGLAGNSGCLWF